MDVVCDVDDDDGARTRILGIRRRPRRRLLALARGDISFTSAVDGGTKLFEKSTLAFEPGVTEEGDALLVS